MTELLPSAPKLALGLLGLWWLLAEARRVLRRGSEAGVLERWRLWLLLTAGGLMLLFVLADAVALPLELADALFFVACLVVGAAGTLSFAIGWRGRQRNGGRQ